MSVRNFFKGKSGHGEPPPSYQNVNHDDMVHAMDLPTDVSFVMTESQGGLGGEAVVRAKKFADANHLTKMPEWVSDGPITFKVLACVAGFALTLKGALGLVFFFEDMLNIVGSFYMFLAGVCIVMMEFKYKLPFIKWAYPKLKKEAKFLYVLAGRGWFYVFIATLLMAKYPSMYDFFFGLYMGALGFAMIVVGNHAQDKIRAMKDHIVDIDMLTDKFKAVDVEGNGSLTGEELANLCKELGCQLDTSEIATALACLDKDGNGTVEYGEFRAWWMAVSRPTIFSEIRETMSAVELHADAELLEQARLEQAEKARLAEEKAKEKAEKERLAAEKRAAEANAAAAEHPAGPEKHHSKLYEEELKKGHKMHVNEGDY